jgi:hypothetical protein
MRVEEEFQKAEFNPSISFKNICYLLFNFTMNGASMKREDEKFSIASSSRLLT